MNLTSIKFSRQFLSLVLSGENPDFPTKLVSQFAFRKKTDISSIINIGTSLISNKSLKVTKLAWNTSSFIEESAIRQVIFYNHNLYIGFQFLVQSRQTMEESATLNLVGYLYIAQRMTSLIFSGLMIFSNNKIDNFNNFVIVVGS